MLRTYIMFTKTKFKTLSLITAITSLSIVLWLQPNISFKWPFLLTALTLILLSWLSNAARFLVLAQIIGLKRPFKEFLHLHIASDFASKTSPGESGAIITYFLFMEKKGVRRRDTSAMITLGASFDILFFALLVSFLFSSAMAYESFIYVIIFIALLITIQVANRIYSTYINRSDRLSLKKLQQKINETYPIRFPRWKNVIYLLITTTLYWGSRYLTLWASAKTLGIPISIHEAATTQVLANGVGAATLLPLGGGSVEISSFYLLNQFSVSTPVIITLIIWRTFTVYIYFIIGPIAIYKLFKKNQSTESKP